MGKLELSFLSQRRSLSSLRIGSHSTSRTLTSSTRARSPRSPQSQSLSSGIHSLLYTTRIWMMNTNPCSPVSPMWKQTSMMATYSPPALSPTDHFRHEEALLALSGTYSKEELYKHINKHNSFLATVRGLSTPVPQNWIDFAKNWLTQHISNTDFKYKNKMAFPVSDPYVWDESFEVHYTRLDEEHKVLFRIMQQLKDNPDDLDVLNNNRDVFRDHFDYEEKQFMACGELCDADAHKKKHDIFFKTLTWVTNPVSTEYLDWATNWLAQHIKNTDFKYRYKLATNHKTPEPYIWNEEFQVSYKRLDDEHIGLFESMYDLEMNLSSQEKVDNLQRLMRDHFYYEEAQFCDALDLPWDYCKEHKKKHVKFSERLAKIVAPVDMAEIKWAQNRLV